MINRLKLYDRKYYFSLKKISSSSLDILNLVLNFKIRVEEFNRMNRSTGLQSVFSNFLLNIDLKKIKYIIVGDNPGESERLTNYYMVGSAGINLRKFFRDIVTDFDKEVLVLNKSSISTGSTEELENVYNKNAKPFLEDQEEMAQLLFDIHNILKVPVFIMAYTSYLNENETKWIFDGNAKSRPLYKFFDKLSNLYKGNPLVKSIIFISHSSHNCLLNEFNESNLKIVEKEKWLLQSNIRNELPDFTTNIKI